MATDRIAEIRARLEAATPEDVEVVKMALQVPPEGHHRNCESRRGHKCDCFMRFYTPALDALERLDHAPDDIRYLLDEVEDARQTAKMHEDECAVAERRAEAAEAEATEQGVLARGALEERDYWENAVWQAKAEVERSRESMKPNAETRDYLTRTIATIRNHRDADNCWPQWANHLADEVERMWAALHPDSGEAK